MPKKLRIVLAQLNLTVGDVAGNLQKHIQAANRARDEFGADVIVYPELGLTGYPPEDLLLRKAFIQESQDALQQFVADVKDIYCVVSHPYVVSQGLYNACSLIYNGSILGRYAKQFLPNYGIFDEYRYFVPGNMTCVIPIKGIPAGIVICEDLWVPGPTQQAAAQGARFILSPNASPFEIEKHEERLAVLSKRAKHNHIPIFYCNNIGAQDGIVFDGGSMVIDEDGQLAQFAGFFNETLLVTDINVNTTQAQIETIPVTLPSKEEKIYQALVSGLRDYIEKNRISSVLVGVSGGIDSALTIAIAVDALGKDKVEGVLLPSRYTAEMSMEDAHAIVKNLGVKSRTISIEPAYQSFLDSLIPELDSKEHDVTEENIQSRCRAVILMALSNKLGSLLLTTGNRSELAVGYCTLFGDMAGGFAVLKDIPKTMIYDLARYRNNLNTVIPERVFERPPTAELAPNQKDEDSLPPYSILDSILDCYLNKEQSMEEIIAQGFDPEIVIRVVNLIRKNEYKRHQAVLGTRINHKAFGKDRRYPVTNGWKG